MNWKSFLDPAVVSWLLEPENPSVQYTTLVDVLDTLTSDPVVKRAQKDIMETGVVPKILAKQKKGYWGKKEDFYMRSKYKGTVWTFLILAQLSADGADERITKTCEFILDHSQDRDTGGFSYMGGKNGGDHHKVLPCLTGNMVWGLITFGLLEDERVQQGIDWICRYQRFDDRGSPPVGWPYSYEKCWGRHTCSMGVVKALKALAAIPEQKRSPPVKETIKKGAEYLLQHHLYKKSSNNREVAKKEWVQFGFPLMWDTDALEMLDILTALQYNDPRMQDAVDLVMVKQDEKKWILERTWNNRFQINIEKKNTFSKWITVKCLSVLKRYT